jgi:hypothetical protein
MNKLKFSSLIYDFVRVSEFTGMVWFSVSFLIVVSVFTSK